MCQVCLRQPGPFFCRDQVSGGTAWLTRGSTSHSTDPFVSAGFPLRPASSTTAAPAGTGSTPWTSSATTGPSCATRRTETPARVESARAAKGLKEEEVPPLSRGPGCPPSRARCWAAPRREGAATAPPPGTGECHSRECSLFALARFFAVHSGTMHSDFGREMGPSHLHIFFFLCMCVCVPD